MFESGMCTSYLAECPAGIHEASDIYKIALFTEGANLTRDTTVYTTDHEAAGDGYVPGGQDLAGFEVSIVARTAIVDFTVDPTWDPSTITARGALVYNSSKGNRAVGVMDFLANKSSTNGPFIVRIPPPAPATALIRFRG